MGVSVEASADMVAFETPLGEITASRTLVKSEPEIREMLGAIERLNGDHVSITMSEKGFGTRVEIKAGIAAGLGPAELEGLLDELAEPRRQPFSK